MTRPGRDSVRLQGCSAHSYHAGDYQQYLAKNPFGYHCHANTGVRSGGHRLKVGPEHTTEGTLVLRAG